jgi:hypothetical protein
MRRGLSAAAAVLLAMVLASPALAEGPSGIGFAQAEEGTWWCLDETVGATLDCARQKCLAESGSQECHATRWCFPAGWSALMVVWLPEFHSTHVLCGMPGEQAARDAMRAICAAGAEFSRCDLLLLIDPDGKETDVSDQSWPGPSASTVPSP